MAGRETFDISPTQRAILEQRAARRNKLRYEYLKQTQNPYRHGLGCGGMVEDTAINRYMAMKVTGASLWRPTVKNALFWFASFAVPVVGMGYLLNWDRTRRNHMLRTGQISYRDRDWQMN